MPISYRQLAKSHTKNNNNECSRHFKRTVIEGKYHGKTDKSPRQRDWKHGKKIHNCSSREFFTEHQKRQSNAEDRADCRRGHGCHPGVHHDIGVDDALFEILKSEGVIRTERNGKGKKHDHADNHKDAQAEKHAESKETPCCRRSRRHTDEACHGLSRNGNVRVLFQIIPLYKENNECRNDKEYGKRGAHGKIPGTGDLCVCFRGQNMVITADQHGVAKVRQ